MIMEGCQGKPRTPTISEKICPNCGNPIEIFSTDTEVADAFAGIFAPLDAAERIVVDHKAANASATRCTNG